MGCCASNCKNVQPPTNNNIQFHHISSRETLKYDENFKGPLSKRSCTDVLCLSIFIVFLVCWALVGIYAQRNGNLSRLLVPTDSEGRKCGIDNGVLNKPYLVFFNIEKCISASVPLRGCQTPQVCVQKCPNESFYFKAEACKEDVDAVRKQMICKPSVDISKQNCDQIEELIKAELCAQWYLPSRSFKKRCLPNNITAIIDLITSKGDKVENVIHGEVTDLPIMVEKMKLLSGMSHMIVDDIMQTWVHILIGLLVATLASLTLIALMRWMATPLVWLSVLGIIGSLGFAVYACFTKFMYLRNRAPTDVNIHTNLSKIADTWLQKPNFWLFNGIAATITLVIILLIVLVLRKRIVIAIALVKEGSKAVSSIKSTVFFPIFPWIFQLAIIGFAILIGLFLASVGTPVNQVVRMSNDTSCRCTDAASHYQDGVLCDPKIFNQYCVSTDNTESIKACRVAACNFKQIASPSIVTYFQAMNVFGFFWVIFFIAAFSDMVLASTFATWYWTFHKSNVPFFTLSHGLGRTIRYHLGTLAFGSLIITICRIIRIILDYIDQKLKKYNNEVTRCILCCMKCFFWCLERFIRFMSKNAYIMCAIHGKPFCTSARDAFSLLTRNFLRVVALDKVTEFLFFLTKACVSIGMGAAMYYYFTNAEQFSGVLNPPTQLHYINVPIAIVMIGTYLIASLFFSVYSTAVDTLFMCFLEDCERNDGSEDKPYFMSKQLMKILGKKNLIPREEYD